MTHFVTELPEQHIDVWLLPISGWTHKDVPQDAIIKILSADEQERFLRFRPTRKKDEFVASRLLLRHLLTTYTKCEIASTEAIPDEMGRPFWCEAGVPINLFFSLSHCKKIVCCAVSKNKEIGCDVESLQPRKYEVELTERVLSEQERKYYYSLPEQSRSDFFYRSWTLKEAFIKAVGKGLRVPLSSLSFTYRADSDTAFKVPPNHLGDGWTTTPYFFKSYTPTTEYSLAIASPLSSPTIDFKHTQLKGLTIVSVQP